MKARIEVHLKEGVLDPEGAAIDRALRNLGFEGVTGIRQGRLIEMELAENDREAALAQVRTMCEQLLTNPVIETYTVALAD